MATKKRFWKIVGMLVSAFIISAGVVMIRSQETFVYNSWTQIASGLMLIGLIGFIVFLILLFV